MKERLDIVLVSRGLAESQHKAQALIMAGEVLVGDVPVDKPGTRIPPDAVIRLRDAGSTFVGRGGDKISGAFDHFQIHLHERVAIDIGASTGGFTDCMLQRGAARVYAVDVGRNQLSYQLRVDERVVVMEQTHAGTLQAEQFDPRPGLAAVDVSFTSVRKLLEPVSKVLTLQCEMLILVKPQFELPREQVSEGGVVPDAELQRKAVDLVSEYAQLLDFTDSGRCPSQLTGQKKGNQEHFLYLRRI